MNISVVNSIILILTLGVTSVTLAQECDTGVPQTTPNSRFTVNGDGTVSDLWNNLMWKQCTEGMSSNGENSCDGTATKFDWQGALNQAGVINSGNAALNAGYDNWRLPNAKELLSIIERQCVNPALNELLFPVTPISNFWTSTGYSSAGSVWLVTMNYGAISSNGATSANFYARMVRDM